MAPFLPQVITDCNGIVDGLAGVSQWATGPKKALARTWQMVSQVLDGDFVAARQLVTWMPAHGSAASIGHAKDSRGHPIDATMWRANRLVDLFAKAAAAGHRLPAWALDQVQNASSLFLHHAARLGKATHDANNFSKSEIGEHGEVVTTVAKDSTAAKPWMHCRRCSRVGGAKAGQPVATLTADSPAGPLGECKHELSRPSGRRPSRKVTQLPADLACSRKRIASRVASRLRADSQAEAAVARWVAGIDLRPSGSATASERMSALHSCLSSRLQPRAQLPGG